MTLLNFLSIRNKYIATAFALLIHYSTEENVPSVDYPTPNPYNFSRLRCDHIANRECPLKKLRLVIL